MSLVVPFVVFAFLLSVVTSYGEVTTGKQLLSHFSNGGETFGLGSSCSSNTTCSADVSNSYCNTFGMCECSENFVPDRNNERCLQTNTIRIGAPCERLEQCMGYNEMSTVCLGGSEIEICDCTDGYIHNNNLTKCLQIVDSLDSTFCSEDIQCHFGTPGTLSSCISKGIGDPPHYVCKCSPNAVHKSGSHKCLGKAMFVGDPCEAQAQCTTNLGFSRCVDEVCRCNPGYVSNGDPGTACVPA